MAAGGYLSDLLVYWLIPVGLLLREPLCVLPEPLCDDEAPLCVLPEPLPVEEEELRPVAEC